MSDSARVMDSSPSGRLSRSWGTPLLAALMLSASCGGEGPPSGTNTASAPGITATTITVGSHQPLTGPAASGYSEISQASSAYFRWVNDHGGVYGRQIKYLYADDGYNPQTTSTVVRK